ncbi:dnaJ homolog subfamily C member 11 [Episyrphus balteatus]|uniref:dnaJ homolog subfamily C member 11 n=1 Tax=Episyrphus balteatus TaxID=286459 RepID=UPI0024857889|nr:dnaJ homolog subfamily C member 11 [Episyrphus balteatus]
MSDDDEATQEVEENYYAFLNLPKNATSEQINAAYRKLSRIYHPDKHVDPNSKHKAETLFNRTKRAYEVLSDPHKRAIYDCVGEKGLKTDGWEIVHRTKTPAEIREEYENLARAQEERKLLQRTNPRGNITINVNATELFAPYDDDEIPKIEVSSMSISQSIEAPITLKDTVTMSGNLHSSNGTGSGNFLISGRRLINKGWLELDLGAGNGPMMGVKGSRNLSQKVFCNGGLSLNFRESGVVPAFVTTLAVQLDKHTIGYLTYNASAQSSMSTSIESQTEKHAWNTSLLIGVPHCYITASYTRKLIQYELKLKVAVKAGTFGFLTECGAEKKVSKYSSVVATVSVGRPTGVYLRLKLIRSNQTYVFPIHLSDEIVPAAIFYATIAPVIGWFLIKKTLIDPMNQERKSIEIKKTRKNNEQRLALKKEEARAAVELMMHTYERIVLEENDRQGLIILKAVYGAFEQDDENESKIDVTIPTQCLVNTSTLILYNSTKSELPGFYDPCIGEEKSLYIEYSYQNQQHSISIKDTEAIRLPLRE